MELGLICWPKPYKHVVPNGAPALRNQLFNRATFNLISVPKNLWEVLHSVQDDRAKNIDRLHEADDNMGTRRATGGCADYAVRDWEDKARTQDSTRAAICDQPVRSLGVDANSSASPIASLIAAGRGSFRLGGRASKAPARPQGTTGTFVSATSIPRPCLNGFIEPSRLRPPSGKMMKMDFSSCNFRRKSASACGPQFFRHIGKALSIIAEKVLVTVLWKKTSPAAMGKARSRWRGVRAAPRASASRWLQWFAASTNDPCAGSFSRPIIVSRCAIAK